MLRGSLFLTLAPLVLGAFLATGCDSGEPGGPPPSSSVFLLVGDPGSLNESERGVRDALTSLIGAPTLLDDDGFDSDDAGGCRIVVVSKTVQSDKVGSELRPVSCGVLFWEDNAQMLGMLATIDNDGSGGTAWHTPDDDVHVRPDAPAELRAGLSGEIDLYTRRDEITFAPRDDLIDDAVVVAELDEPGGHPTIYVVAQGVTLADGSRAAGRRAYFGLYDDTFRHLTADGRALFDAAVRWAAD